MVGGKAVAAPTGRYQIVRYDKNKPVYFDLGNDPTDALARYRVEQARHDSRSAVVPYEMDAPSIAVQLEVQQDAGHGRSIDKAAVWELWRCPTDARLPRATASPGLNVFFERGKFQNRLPKQPGKLACGSLLVFRRRHFGFTRCEVAALR
jgi:hypothetical protein